MLNLDLMTIGGVVKSEKCYFLETLKVPIYFLMIKGNFCNVTHFLLMVEKKKRIIFFDLEKFKISIYLICFKDNFLKTILSLYMEEDKKFFLKMCANVCRNRKLRTNRNTQIPYILHTL